MIAAYNTDSNTDEMFSGSDFYKTKSPQDFLLTFKSIRLNDRWCSRELVLV